jgi:spermidine synthase
MTPPRPRALAGLTVCFFLSGLAALIYQTAWTRELAFVFGTSELAVATVLAAYMAGLAAGAALAGRLAPRIRRPVLAYGWLELGVAVSALLVPVGLDGATRLLLALYGGEPGLPDASHQGIGLFYAAIAFGLLMLPTLFMGATLPLLVRHAVGSDDELGQQVSRLYAWNTGGAVVGTVLTAFLLLPQFGLGQTVWIAVAVNTAVFVVAAWLARGSPPPPAEAARLFAPAADRLWVLPAVALSGVVSFTGEVLWTRSLSHLLGGSVYAFATMLSSVLLGIALGALAASRWADSGERAGRAFAFAQLGAALFSVVAFLAVAALPDVLPRDLDPYAALGLGALVCAAILLPGSLCFGATYPLAVRILASSADEAGPASARVYTWNTGGAIVGALSAAYWTLPTLGFEGTLSFAVALNVALSIAAVAAVRSFRASLPFASVGAVLLGGVLMIGPPVSLLLHGPLGGASGVLRDLRIGRSASVTVSEAAGRFDLRTNGLPESRIRTPAAPPGELIIVRWMGALPTVLRPKIENLVIVGLGGGVSLERVPASVERIHVIELEAEVVAANRALGPARAIDPLSDPRVTVHENDARSALLLSGDRFDAVVAQASHPWTAGSAHLYTREFFGLVASRLEPGGVFVQWMGAAYVNEPLLRTIVATLVDTWPHVRVYQPYSESFLFVASDQPFADSSEVDRFHARDPEAARGVGLVRADDLDAVLYLDDEASKRFALGAEICTDDRNLLQMRSPFVRGGSDSIGALGAPGTGAEAAVTLGRLRSLLDRGAIREAAERAERVPARDRVVARAMGAVTMRRFPAAARATRQALAARPADPVVRAQAYILAALHSATALPELEAPHSVAEMTVAAALAAREAESMDALVALDERLAAIEWGDPLHRAALELRIAASGDAATILALVDEALPVYRADAGLLLHRARAARTLDLPETLLGSLEALVGPAGSRKANGSDLVEVRRILADARRTPHLEARVRALHRVVSEALAKQRS